MIGKKENRLRRARATRARIKNMQVNRLVVHRTNLHIYAQIISADGKNVLCAASTLEPEVVTVRQRWQRQCCKSYRKENCREGKSCWN